MVCSACIAAVPPPSCSSGEDHGRGPSQRMQTSSQGTRQQQQQQGNKYSPFPTNRGSSVVPVAEGGDRPLLTTPCPHTHASLSELSQDGISELCSRVVGGRRRRGGAEEEADSCSRLEGSGVLCAQPQASVLDQSTTTTPPPPQSRLVRLPPLLPRVTVCSTPVHSGCALSSANLLAHYKHLPQVTSAEEADRLRRTMQWLQAGCFYYKDLDSSDARSMLRKAPEGTFLVRDSSDPTFLFSITVKTARGPTSARIRYQDGLFQLDCSDHMKQKLPRFETLLDLLDFHRTACRKEQGSKFRWQESSRRMDLVIHLTAPRRHAPPSLAHLARLAVNQSLQEAGHPHPHPAATHLLPVPDSLKQFLRGYPFRL